MTSDSSRARRANFQPGTPRNTFIIVVPILVVLVTFLFWYQTWFGRSLSDQEMGQYLSDASVPHKTQHALAQLSDRMARGDATTGRWYPQVISLAGSKQAQFRSMAAWVMGQDNRCEAFHQTLRGLLDDPAPLVRSNAALALVRFGDVAAEPQLQAMLLPFTLNAPQAGRLEYRAREGDSLQTGGIVARLSVANDGKLVDVVSPIAGSVARRAAKDGAQVGAGDAIAVISPGESQAFEALRALTLVGHATSLPEIDHFAAGAPGISARVRQQAVLTAQAIRQRTLQSKGVK